MKKYLTLVLTAAFFMVMIPVSVYGIPEEQYVNEENTTLSLREVSGAAEDMTISVYNSESGEISEMNFRKYIIGVVAGEMPVEFHSEALSAQCAAAATVARRRMMLGGSDSLSGAVISTDPSVHQAYLTEEQMRERWGDDFEKYYEKLVSAVDEAIGYGIFYDGQLIDAVYHAVSTGVTEDAVNVWSDSEDYLKSTDSEGDKLSPKYSSLLVVPFSEFQEKMKEKGVVLGEDKALWISGGVYSDAGTLLSVNIGDKSFSGSEIRDMFSLRSAAVTMSITSEGVNMDVKGYGHGVGLSQYGADYLARQGYTWQEILTHYYSGVTVEKL